LPAPAGQGNARDNPTVVDWKAEAATLPGPHGGPVMQAYANAFMPNADGMAGGWAKHLASTLAREDESRAFKDKVFHAMRAKVDATAASLNHDQAHVWDTAISNRNAEQQAMHEVQKARKKWEETAIKKRQTEKAAILGSVGGQAVGYRQFEEMYRNEMNQRVMQAQRKEDQALRSGYAKAHHEGLDIADMYQSQQEVALKAYQKQLDNQLVAIKAHAARDAGIIEESMGGAEDIKNTMIRDDAKRTVARYNRRAVHNKGDIHNAVVHGVGAVRRDMIADAITSPGIGEA